jgi:myo-inositol-1(or 4)-monophosphatase
MRSFQSFGNFGSLNPGIRLFVQFVTHKAVGRLDLLRELEIALQAARAAGAIVMKYYQNSYHVRDKSPNNPVTTADFAANDCIREIIHSAFPDDGWLSEETKDSPERLAKSRVWVIDPIDGTEEFIEGKPEFAISIAFVVDSAPVVGALYNPAADELYYAQADGGAFCNGALVHCSSRQSLSTAAMLVSQSEQRKGLLDGLTPLVAEIHYAGGVACKLARLAAGRSDLYVTLRPKNEWDFCAGDLILREAGGVLWNRTGQPMRYNKPTVRQAGGLFAGNPALVRRILDEHLRTTPAG